VGVPLLGFIYFLQFQTSFREHTVPFQTFKAPITTVYKDQSKSTHTLEWKSPITVVNFWATWCPPCLEEFPSMIELNRKLDSKGVEFVFISVDDNWEKVEKFLHDNVIEVKKSQLFWDADKNASTVWGSQKFPETYVVRNDGWVLEKIVGAQRWTRPAIEQYFSDLAKDTSTQISLFKNFLFPSAWAQEDSSSVALIHEDDKKTLETLRKNIEISSKNLLQAEAALKSEKRSLEELNVLSKKQDQAYSEAKDQKSELDNKKSELDKLSKKNKSSLDNELQERKKVEQQIKDSQIRIEKLEKELETEKVKLVETQKALNTRAQNIESLEKAKESLAEDTEKLDNRLKGTQELVKEKDKDLSSTQKSVSERKKSLLDLEAKVKSFEKIVNEQKKKLLDFENLLRK
jgi:thiol-disulfide isomerase/thioredoxin